MPKEPAGMRQDKQPEQQVPNKLFPFIGLGSSAGGLEALKAFFATLPKQTGMAYIAVSHMDPHQPSMLPEILQKVTHIPVSTVKDGQLIAPDQIYVTPPGKEIEVFKGKLQLFDIKEKAESHSIDQFFRSLAQDKGNLAAAVILSGTGSDGTLGAKEIKACNGLVVAQSEKTASFDGMPRSAISCSGLVDMILAPEDMPEKLVNYFSYQEKENSALDSTVQKKWLQKIFAILRTQIGHDFSVYKTNTILRRINRRMGLNHIESHETYVRYLRENQKEVDALFQELLIGVTSFFRDPESFEILKNNILPTAFESISEDSTFRAWIPGCSTGEEVYSLAMVFREVLDKNSKRVNLQLFGTDIDNNAIEKAREGIYPSSIANDVSSERLKRFFTKEGDFYRIKKEIRDCVVFSVQDIVKDPPFSRLDLLCCRNLLIYLDAEAQRKLLPLFHYTLKSSGILVLGSSETIGGFNNLFETMNKKWKIFKSQEVPHSLRHIVEFPSGLSNNEKKSANHLTIPTEHRVDLNLLTQKAVLDQFAPTAILINIDGDILNVQGRTGKYLETPSGPPTNNILDLAREGLRIELSSAIRAAKSSSESVTRNQISVRTNGDVQLINLHVSQLKEPQELAGRFLVVFEDILSSASHVGSDSSATEKDPPGESRISELERELQVTRESHQTTIEELESSNEELKSTNEEMQSSNEELQSTNEELESSKEELQSLNEELQTVNSELQSKVDELSAAHDDMRNLLNSTEIATIFVDNEMKIRRFTTEATKIVNLIMSDIGRPLQHVVSNLKYKKMIHDLEEVIKHLSPVEHEVQTVDGQWFNMRIIPYRTTDNRIDGAVLTFSSIVDQKEISKELQLSLDQSTSSWELIRAVFDMNEAPMVVLDDEKKLVIANKSYTNLINKTQEEVTKKSFLKSLEGLVDVKKLQPKFDTFINTSNEETNTGNDFEIAISSHQFIIRKQLIKNNEGASDLILLSFIH